MIARFGLDGVALDLDPREYAFLHLALSFVLHGVSVADEFQVLLGMSREEAENLYSRMQAAEVAARERGDHWLGPRPPPE